MNTKILKKALFAWILFFCGMSSFFLSCWRDNPVDAKSGKYIPGSRPHVQFVEHSISAFLFDLVTFKIERGMKGMNAVQVSKVKVIPA